MQQDLEGPISLSWPSPDLEAEETDSSLKMLLSFSEAPCLLRERQHRPSLAVMTVCVGLGPRTLSAAPSSLA